MLLLPMLLLTPARRVVDKAKLRRKRLGLTDLELLREVEVMKKLRHSNLVSLVEGEGAMGASAASLLSVAPRRPTPSPCSDRRYREQHALHGAGVLRRGSRHDRAGIQHSTGVRGGSG